MSYDLNFWKYESNSPSNDHQSVYLRLSNGERVEGLANIPIDDILRRIEETFSSQGWTSLDSKSTWESAKGAFQVFTTPQFFRVDCYGMRGEDMNCFINIASEFGLPLYDPQVGKRFGG